MIRFLFFYFFSFLVFSDFGVVSVDFTIISIQNNYCTANVGLGSGRSDELTFI